MNPVGIAFCRKRHNVPGLDFVQGDAENLPFPDQSFDAVINIESSHCYPRFPRFLAEVARVLRPGGHFLYADLRADVRIGDWEAELAGAPIRLRSHADIKMHVLRGLRGMESVVEASRPTPRLPADRRGRSMRRTRRKARNYTAQCKGISRTECTVSPRAEAAPRPRDRLTVVTTSTLPR